MEMLGRYARAHPELMPIPVSLMDDKNASVRYAVLRPLGDRGNASLLPAFDRIAAVTTDRAIEAARESAEKVRSRMP